MYRMLHLLRQQQYCRQKNHSPTLRAERRINVETDCVLNEGLAAKKTDKKERRINQRYQLYVAQALSKNTLLSQAE